MQDGFDGGEQIGRMVFAFEATPNGSRVTTTTYFHSAADLERLVTMGMEQGMKNGNNDLTAHLAELDRLRARGKIGRRDHQTQRANAEHAAAGGDPLPPVRMSKARKWAGRAADLLAGGLGQ